MKFLLHSGNLINLAQAICIYKFTATGAKAQYRIRFDFPARPKKEEYYQIAFETEQQQDEFFAWIFSILDSEMSGVLSERDFNLFKEKLNGKKESSENRGQDREDKQVASS